MPSKAAACQDAALAALRHLDAHTRSIALHKTAPQACRPAPLPPRFLPVLQPPEACRPWRLHSTTQISTALAILQSFLVLLDPGSRCNYGATHQMLSLLM